MVKFFCDSQIAFGISNPNYETAMIDQEQFVDIFKGICASYPFGVDALFIAMITRLE